MSLSALSVRRPVTTAMMTLIVLLIGAVALTRLPIDLLPEVDMPTLSVSTTYENASPEEVERLVTEVIEDAVAAVSGVEEITSTSAEGLSNVRLSLTWGTDLDVASNDVRDRLDRISDELPEEVEKPQLRKFDPANFPIVLLGVSSPLDPIELTDLIDTRVSARLGRLPGVAQVDTWGGFEREVQVRLDRDRMNALQLPLQAVIDAIRAANINVPAGSVDRDRLEVTMRTPGEFRNLDELRHTVIRSDQGSLLRLADIAEVADTHRDITRVIRINGEPGVRLAVRKQSGVNTAEVAERVIAEIGAINAEMSQLQVEPLFDQSQFIRRSINNVGNSVLLGGFFAILVLLFFLRNLRSTLVIGLAIPISVIATFALVHFAGFTLNLMTLGGLALGVGMMVDNSIVVLENIFRRRKENDEAPAPAAVAGAGEVAGAITASTLTTLVIFLPLVFAQGVSSILFQQLAAVIAFSLLCSLLVSLTLVPTLASKLLVGGDRQSGPGLWQRLNRWAGTWFTWLDDTYRELLALVLRHRLLTIAGALLALVASLPLVNGIGTELMPETDEGDIRVSAEMEVGTRLDILDQQTRKLEALVRAHVPELRNLVTSAGPSSWRPSASATADLRLNVGPASERQRSHHQIARELRDQLEGQVAGMTVRVRARQGLRILNRLLGSGDESLGVEIYGFNLQTLDDLALQVEQALAEVDGITDAMASRESGVPQELLRIDRERAADLGLNVQDIARTLETAVAGRQAGDYREGGQAIRILVRLDDAQDISVDELLAMTVPASDGTAVPLRAVVAVEPGLGPMLIDRKDQQRLVSVAANISGRDLGSVAADVATAIAAIPLPVGYSMVIAGDYEEQQESFRELLLAMVLALVLVYMVLASQYESLRDPLVVMFSVPLAAIGVLITLFLTGTTFNVQSYIGCIMLGGIVVNNAILLVDQAGRLRTEGMATTPAVAEAGRRRLRPILMTTLTTMLGLLPLALGYGDGAEAQAPLARAVIGGLFTSTLITLVLIPALYSLVHPESAKENP